MSLNFGKGNLSIAYNPTSAFPIDARTYFEDIPNGKTAYEQALEAAKGAEEVGSTNTKYHYGMKLLVNQDGAYTWYQISESGSLIAESGSVDVDSIVELVLAKLPSDSPLPIEILTETEMTAILENATHAGAVYKYTGETTDIYTQGELYIIQEE